MSEQSPSNDVYQLSDFIEWDVANWSAALDYWKAHSVQDLAGSSALEIGTNYGGLSLWLASQGASVTSTDRYGPKAEAIAKHRDSHLSPLIKHAAVDALDIPYKNSFDIVVFKSVLGILGDPCTRETQATAVAGMYHALKQGGELFFAENLSASPLHKFLRARFVEWGTLWRYPSITEMLGYLSPFARVDYTTIGFAGTFGRSERQRNALGSMDRILIDRMVPASWKYIMVGVARK